jgi:alkylhydroperoxidase family enzyme
MTPRIPPATPPFAPKIADRLDKIMPPGVPPLALFTTLARDERLFGRFMGASLLDRGHLSLRQRELVIDRICARSGSEYEWGVHMAFFADQAGFDAVQRRSLAHGGSDDPCWSDDDRLILAMCDELHDTCDLADPTWARLSARFDDMAIVEMLMLAGFYRTVSYLTNALRLAPEAYAPRFDSV